MLIDRDLKYGYLPQDVDGYEEMCDAYLLVAGQRFPIHSAVLGVHSRFLRKMIVDLRNNRACMGPDGKLEIPLDESVSVRDATLMLAFVYGQRPELESAEEASRMVMMADKFDMPAMFQVSDKKIYELVDRMHFTLNGFQSDPWLDAGHWLGIADRLGMEKLRCQCQHIILRDIADDRAIFTQLPGVASPGLERALSSLDGHGVTAKSMGEITAALVDALYRRGFLHCSERRACCTSCGRMNDLSDTRGTFNAASCTYECPSCRHRTPIVAKKHEGSGILTRDDTLQSLKIIRFKTE